MRCRAMLVSVIGVGCCAGGCGDDGRETMRRLPAQVWGGGGSKVTLDVYLTHPGEIYASFTEPWTEAGDDRMLEAWQSLGAGAHQFTIDVPRDVSGTFEAQIKEPPVGAQVELSVDVNGRPIWSDSDTLTEPLGENYAFFVQVHFDDVSVGQLAQGGLWD